MSTPVVTSKWAGNFDCSVCRRKRLMAEEFSKSSLEKHRKTGQAMRCKQCTAKQEQEKRAAKANTSSTNNNEDANDANETRMCAGPCQKVLKKDAYNRNQWSKPVGKSRCRECVEKAIQEESNQQKNSKDDKIESLRKKIADLRLSKTSTPQQIVAAESELAAIEAEKVTGLKPIKLGGRGGRARRNFGAGRGRGGRTSGRGRIGRK